MFLPKRVIGILLSVILIFTNTSAYSHPENLASNSLFKLWEKKKIDPQQGLIIEARLRAIHSGISQGRRTPKDLSAIDEEVTQKHTSAESLTKYPFNYTLQSFKDKRIWGMMRAKIYKDKYGYRQLVLFYDPNNPPWDILTRFGVKTKDREFAKRGFWVTHEDTPPDPGRRIFLLTSVALISACVLDPSGLPGALDGGITPDAGFTADAGPTTDGGTQPINAVEQEIQIIMDNSNNPVTILPSSEFTSDDTAQRLSALPQFVRNNNAAFRYNGQNWHWTLSEGDRQDIINNGLTYIFNGRNHRLKLIGQDNDGQTKAIIFTPRIPGIPDSNQPYRVIIRSELLQQLAQQIGLDINTINIYVENLETTENFILNGFQKQYAVLTSSEEVAPDFINPESSTSASEGVQVESTPTGMRFTMIAGNNGQYARLNIPTRSGGVPLSNPNLQCAWKMDGVDLGTDSGPNGNELININDVESVPGRFGNAARFTAVNQSFLTIPPEAQNGLDITGDMTVSAWVKINSFSRGGFVVATRLGGPGIGSGYQFAITSDGTDRMSSWTGSSQAYSDIPVPLGTWHHVSYVRSGDYMNFYLDGELVGSSYQVPESPTIDPPFYVGTNNGNTVYADGELDELAIFDRALTSEEVQGIYNQVDSSNFSSPTLSTLEFRVRGNSPFILKLTDNEDRELNVFVTGLDPNTMQNIAIDLEEAHTIMNPAFNLGNVRLVEIKFEDTFLPVPDGEELEVFIAIQGLVGTPDGTRGEYAYDPDLTEEERRILVSKLEKDITQIDLLPIEGHPVVGIESWNGILTPDGLHFKPKDNKFSAFHIGDTIYIPAPDMIMDKIHIGGEERYNLRNALYRRNNTILYHELHEIKGWDHKQAVLSEFEDDITGLNYADIVTILLSVLIDERIKKLDINFHELFIKKLLSQGMPLNYDTYSEILRQTLGIKIDSGVYDIIIKACQGLVRTYIGDKPLYTEGITVDVNLEKKIQDEPGYDAFTEVIKDQPEEGTILIELDRFFVRNDSLSDVVTIDTLYFERFIHFAKNLSQDIVLVGITHRPETDIYTRQLIDLILHNLHEDRQSKFKTYYEVDFSDYHTRLITEGIDIQSAVTILSEESAGKIERIADRRKQEDRKRLKIIAPFWSGYNRVATVWQEFRIAIEGIEKSKSEFLEDIIKIATELLNNLVDKKQITLETRARLLRELQENGIWYIPVYFDPRQYYLSIEQMKTLVTNA